LGGDWDTVWQAGYNSTNDSYTFNGASSAIRLIADLSDWERTRFCCTSGQSGTPFSPHYADFIEDWLGGNYHPHLFNRAAILENAEGKLTINPA
jgi:penicillin amidase